MPQSTRFLAKLLGLYLLIVGTAMTVNGAGVRSAAVALFGDRALLLVSGVGMVGLGLAMVLAPNRWRGGAAVIAVTACGWLTLAKGVAFVVMPAPQLAALYLGTLRFEALYLPYGVAVILLGAGLALAGFRGDG